MDLTLSHVSFTYPSGVTALDDVSLRVAEGEALAIIGENGAGKTTLARHLNGLLRPSLGEVTVGDWDTRDQSIAALSRRVGYVFQNPDDQLFARTVQDEIEFGLRNLKHPPDRIRAEVEGALAQVGLSALADRHPYDLHISQRRLVALAAAIATQPPILVLDEPTTGQDADGVELIAKIVDDQRAHGRTVITITHDIDFCAEHFPRVLVMAQGRILDDGPVAEVLSRRDTLDMAEVDPPQMIRLAAALGLSETPLTAEAFVDALKANRRAPPLP